MKHQHFTIHAFGPRGHPTHFLSSEFEQRLRVLELSVQQLIAQTRSGELLPAGFDEVNLFLEAAPLTLSDYATAKLHVQNALRYCRISEFGAATFELRIVCGILQRL